MKEAYAKKKVVELESARRYQCENCRKVFCGSDFVKKHFFNKHEDVLKQKFNSARFEKMRREAYFADPAKIINTPNLMNEGFHGGGFRGGRGGFRKDNVERDEKKYREYIDHDDPERNRPQAGGASNPVPGRTDRELISYDDLF